MSCLKKIMVAALVLGLIAVLAIFVLIKVNSKPLPVGQQGEAADALARDMMAAINHEAWLQTGAVSWNFGGRQQHLWDRKRHLARVRFKDMDVLIDLTKRSGIVRRAGEILAGEEAQPYLEKAWAFWANDSFWLNPISKVFDEGTSRALVDVGEPYKGLLVTYDAGGVTPGDSYLWVLDQQNLPVRWEMWVSIIPIGGFQASWSDWQTTATGFKTAQSHDMGVFVLELKDIKAATSVEELEPGADPFAELL